MQFNGESIDLSKITMPLLTIVAEDDDLVSPESTLAVASYVSSKDKLSLTIPGDHISLCVSTDGAQEIMARRQQNGSSLDDNYAGLLRN